MIELLGVGVPRARGGGWLLHGVCATLEAGDLTLVLSTDPAEGAVLLDAITGRRVPRSSSAWRRGPGSRMPSGCGGGTTPRRCRGWRAHP